MVFKSSQRLFNNNSKLETAMQQGILSLKLGYFPAMRNYDSSKTEGLNWRYTYGYWVLSDIEDSGSVFEWQAGSYRVQVTELEKRNYVIHLLMKIVFSHGSNLVWKSSQRKHLKLRKLLSF